LAKRHQIAISRVVKPPAFAHKFLAQVTDVRHRPAKGDAPEFEKSPDNFKPAWF
jgi:hypothetical protein